MWPRVVEIVLGSWLVVGPLVLPGAEPSVGLVANNIVCGALVVVLAVASFTRALRRAHLGQLAVALWLVVYAHLQAEAPPPIPYQANVATAFCLVLFAILPTGITRPPSAWTHALDKK